VEQKRFNPYASTTFSNFKGGVYVAAGDVNGDGTPDLLVGPGRFAPAVVEVFDGANLFLGTDTQPQLLTSFTAYAGFLGGVRVAAITLPGASEATIWTAPGPGSGLPFVSEFSFAGAGKPPTAVESLFAGSVFDNGAFIG
jgi:hypothetical protein